MATLAICLTSHLDLRCLDTFDTGVLDLDTLLVRRGVRVLGGRRHSKSNRYTRLI